MEILFIRSALRIFMSKIYSKAKLGRSKVLIKTLILSNQVDKQNIILFRM